MRLYYYKDPRGNFGDDLNLWLWPRLLGDFLDTEHPYYAFSDDSTTDPSETLFVGLGSLLNHHMPKAPHKAVVGAGVAYGDAPRIDDRWTLYAVRGPRSAEILGLDKDRGIGDSGILVRAVELPATEKRFPVSFFSYHENAELVDWDSACRSTGIHHIDPAGSVEGILAEIRQTELLLTEAMHGAIVADALRVPWIPVRVFDKLNDFKWHDWCESLRMRYQPHDLPRTGAWLRNKKGIKGKLLRTLRPRQACKEMRRLAREAEPMLSEDAVIDEATTRLLDQLEQMRQDFR